MNTTTALLVTLFAQANVGATTTDAVQTVSDETVACLSSSAEGDQNMAHGCVHSTTSVDTSGLNSNSQPAHQHVVINAKTPLILKLKSPISSKTAKPMDPIDLEVAEAFTFNGVEIVAAGTPAIGEVIHAQKAGAFGREGELSIAIRYIDLGSTKIPMRSSQPLRGKDRSNMTMMMNIAVSPLLTPLVRGGNVELGEGTEFFALVAKDTEVEIAKSIP